LIKLLFAKQTCGISILNLLDLCLFHYVIINYYSNSCLIRTWFSKAGNEGFVRSKWAWNKADWRAAIVPL